MLLYGLEKDPDFRHLRARLLVSCPAGGDDEGGLFLLDFRKGELNRLHTGGCVGMARVKERWIVATSDNRIVSLDEQFRTAVETEHRKLDFHGMAKLSDQVVLVVETAVNAIGCYETDSFRRIGEIRFHADNKDVFHLNDIWLDGHTLYVSMFSPHDKWYLNPLERSGAIVTVDLSGYRSDRSLLVTPSGHIAVDKLHMPHTVMRHQNKLAYCDSMSFRAVVGDQTIQASGFTRGLAFADNAIFIGQSRMRHVLRIPHEFSNCSLDGGVYVYNPEFRISRFVQLPAQQVYQIAVLPPV